MLKNLAVWMTILLLASGTAHAVTLTPEDLVAQADVDASTSFAWDWDEAPPIGSFTYGGAPGFGAGSWWSNVDGSASGTGRDYTALRLFLGGGDLFGAPVTIAELESISYWTLNANPTLIDWQIKIYTETLDGQTAGWYGHRFNFDRPVNASFDTWYQHSTDSADDPLYVEWIRSGTGTSIYPAAMTLADLAAGYGSETIMWIDIIASYQTDSPPVNSYLDGVTLTVNGNTVALDLEAVPEPMTLAMLGCLGAGMWGARKLGQKKR